MPWILNFREVNRGLLIYLIVEISHAENFHSLIPNDSLPTIHSFSLINILKVYFFIIVKHYVHVIYLFFFYYVLFCLVSFLPLKQLSCHGKSSIALFTPHNLFLFNFFKYFFFSRSYAKLSAIFFIFHWILCTSSGINISFFFSSAARNSIINNGKNLCMLFCSEVDF